MYGFDCTDILSVMPCYSGLMVKKIHAMIWLSEGLSTVLTLLPESDRFQNRMSWLGKVSVNRRNITKMVRQWTIHLVRGTFTGFE